MSLCLRVFIHIDEENAFLNDVYTEYIVRFIDNFCKETKCPVYVQPPNRAGQFVQSYEEYRKLIKVFLTPRLSMTHAMPPFVVGSTHLLSYHNLLSLKEIGVDSKSLGLIVFDEHDDLGNNQDDEPSLASWLGHAIKDELVFPENVFVIGLNSQAMKLLQQNQPKIRACTYEEVNKGYKPAFDFKDKLIWISVDADSIRNFHGGNEAMFLYRFASIFVDAIEAGSIVGVDFVEWRGENWIKDPPIGMEAFLTILYLLISKHSAEIEENAL